MPATTARRRLALWAGLPLLCLLLVSVRVLSASAQLLRAGEEARAAGRSEEAVRSLGRAARMYAPGSPYVARAFAGLVAIAEEAERRGDRPLALLSWREVRSAILAARSLYTPRPALLLRANGRLARLMAEAEEAYPELRGEPLAAREAWHLQALQRDELPHAGLAALALLGAALFIGAGFGLALRGVGEDGRLRRRPALRYALLCLLGFLLMALGLARA